MKKGPVERRRNFEERAKSDSVGLRPSAGVEKAEGREEDHRQAAGDDPDAVDGLVGRAVERHRFDRDQRADDEPVDRGRHGPEDARQSQPAAEREQGPHEGPVEDGPGRERRQDAEGHGPPNDEGRGPGKDEKDDDAGEREAHGHAGERQDIEQDVHRDLDGVDEVEALGRLEDAAERRADEHDRERPAHESDGQDGLGLEAGRDVEDAPDDERRGQVREQGGGDPDRGLEGHGRPDIARELGGFVPAQAVGDVARRRPPQAEIEEPEIAEHDPDEGQDAEALGPQGPDDHGDGHETDGQGHGQPDEVQGRVPDDELVGDVHGEEIDCGRQATAVG